jgi:hypothetical protein
MEQQQALFPSSSTLNLTTGRSGASALLQRRLETAFTLDCERFRALFLATFAILPVFAAPMPSRQLAGRLAVTPVPSPKATPAGWITLLDCHLGIAVADGLAFTTLAGAHYKLLRSSRCTPRTVARQFSRIQGHLPHLGPKR